mgnify:CR=1 FL=1
MFRNLTLAQQMFFFVLAVFLILLVFRILVKLKLAPVLLYAACANLIFPEWVAEQKALYWAILAGLVLVTIFRWDDLPLGRPQADRAHGGAADHAGDRGAEPGGGGHGVSE